MTITEHLTDSRPTDEKLAAFERLVAGALPEDYRTFLKNENGGRPAATFFRFKVKDGREEDSNVHYFYALYEGRIGNLEKTFGLLRGRIPPDYLAIATDAFGNMILLKIATANPGKIYFWDHEKEEDVPTLRNMSPIANSFTEFVEGLKMGPS
jgi:hypothetical protein